MIPVLYSSLYLLCSTWWVGDFLTTIKEIPLSFGEEINMACDTPIWRYVVPQKMLRPFEQSTNVIHLLEIFEMTHILTWG